MHWRLQKILHGLSGIKAGLFNKRDTLNLKSERFSPEAVAAVLKGSITIFSEEVLKLHAGSEQYYIRKVGSDAAVLYEIFVKQEYSLLTEFIRLNNLSVKTVVDVGANIGLAARFFQQQFFPEKIYCIEPHAENAAIARLNLKRFPHIYVHQAALWHKEEEVLYLHRHFRDGQDWSIAASEKSGSLGAGRCSAITMEAFMQKENITHIDLLKVDIEGAEVTLFSPYANTDYLKYVSIICLELHKEIGGYKKIFTTFKKHGFILFESNGILIGYRP
jgi:FkbM family methyltransferase